MGVYMGLVRLRNRGLLASTTLTVHCKEPEVGQDQTWGFHSGQTRWARLTLAMSSGVCPNISKMSMAEGR